MAKRPVHSKVEFTADFGLGQVQAVFVDFSSAGISFGVPRNVRIHHGTAENISSTFAIKVFQRVTIHVDGGVKTHWPVVNVPPAMQSIDRDQLPLDQWDSPWCRQFDLDWDAESLKYLKKWFAKPNPPGDSRCLNVPVSFKPNAMNSVVQICVVKPESSISDIPVVVSENDQMWCLTGGWPWVLVVMSNIDNPGVVELSSAGRDYQRGNQSNC